jgi:hypothetical protein
MTMFHSKYTGTIAKGDLVLIAYDNWMTIGICAGRGKSGTFQYYDVYVISESEKRDPGCSLHSRYLKSYVNSPHSNRITKTHLSLLSDAYQENYWLVMTILEKSGIKF